MSPKVVHCKNCMTQFNLGTAEKISSTKKSSLS
jgi:hypothetical protein